MKKRGPIVIIDDDEDDREIIKEVLFSLEHQNEIVAFPDGASALEYFSNHSAAPFLIICDVNMPGMNGYQLREHLLADDKLLVKTVPFIFFTTAAAPDSVKRAYRQSLQGFFHKPTDYQELQNVLHKIVAYWKTADIPGGVTA
ncbi:response regulator [Flavobacterium sp. ST-75]|uniref:Response regulator n=1 Tax=Flavobacterium rhizophilum TaxID=3163296 RepID=A0ABW8Y957_9FLAO